MKKAISPQLTMQEVLEAYPGAQHALFQQYHIGGCNHCGFQPAETLAEVCPRNDVLNLDDVIEHITTWHEQNGKASATPEEFSSMPLPKSEAPCRTENPVVDGESIMNLTEIAEGVELYIPPAV